MPGIGQDARLPVRRPREPGIGVGDTRMRLVAALLPAPVLLLLRLAGADAGAAGAAGPGGPPFKSFDPAAGFGLNDLWLAQAWISVPSTEKCSSGISALLHEASSGIGG